MRSFHFGSDYYRDEALSLSLLPQGESIVKCAYCRDTNADVYFYDYGLVVWLCDHLCFEWYLWEKSQIPKPVQKSPYFQVGHDSEGTY